MQIDPSDPHNLASPVDEILQTILIATEGDHGDEHAVKLREILEGREGVKEVRAEPENARVVITFDSRKTDAALLHESILRGGYQADPTVAD
ncbi:MAG TPA: heavy-metal-associated domain-containing protein [Chthoniobacterales bacterium]|jgi:copper chaperone CopZ